jgi:uncharacterized membrane protein YgdD (TMEM256/DUF423 family)
MNRRLARCLIAIAALLLAIATALGAIASHALDSVLDAGALRAFETAVDYQFVHALGLAMLALYAERQAASTLFVLAAALLTCGILLFCGGVYASSLDGPGWIAGLAPTGGLALIAGWLVVGITVLRQLITRTDESD